MSNIKRNTFIVTVIMLMTRVLSLSRDMLLAKRFGVGLDNDIFIGSQTIILLFSSFIMQSFISSYLPFATDYYYGNSNQKRSYYATVYFHAFVLGVLQIGICWILLNRFIGLIVPGFTIEAKELLRVAILIQMPIIVIQMINGVSETNLQVVGKYSFVQFGTAIPYLSSILYLFFAEKITLNGLVLCITIGNLLMFLVKIPFVERYFHPRFSKKIWYSEMKIMYGVIGLTIITSAVRQINSIVNQAVSSLLGEGNVTIISYAMKIPATEASLVSLALSMILFVEMAKNISNSQEGKNEKLLSEAIALTITMIVPFTMYTIVYRREIIRVLFEGGAFTVNDTEEVARVMIYYAIGMFAFSLQDIIVRAMFAYKIRRYSLFTSVVLVIINISMNLLLYKLYGNIGIAFSYSFAAIFIIPILLYFCTKNVIKIDWKNFALVSFQTTISTLVAGLVAWTINKGLLVLGFNFIISVIISGVISFVVFIGFSLITKNSVVLSFYSAIRTKLQGVNK